MWSWLTSGLWLWTIGRPSFHIGASTIVYALASFLFFSGLIRRHTRLMAISMFVVFLYGGMVWGILPMKSHISWEGHLSGALRGLILAYWFRKTALLNKYINMKLMNCWRNKRKIALIMNSFPKIRNLN